MARDFNGSTDRIDWASIFTTSGQAKTVSLWTNLDSATGFNASAGGTITTGVWIHILFHDDGSLTGANIHIYMNGTEVTYASNGNTVTETAASGSWSVGGRKDTDTINLNGRIAEVGVWNRELSTGEITALARGYSPMFFSNG